MAKKIFVDTNPFIYLIDKNSPYFQTISDYFNFNRDADFYTSAITDALQLDASIVNECSAFLTNDRQRSQFAQANIVFISDLPA